MELKTIQKDPRTTYTKKFGKTWLILSLILLLHVIDEAVHDFLPFYNSVAENIRSKTGLPVPVFSFSGWLGGLIIAQLILSCLSYYAFNGKRFMVPLAYIYSLIMFLNGMTHLAGSIYFQELVPGVISAPLLLMGSVHLLHSALLFRRHSVHPM